MTDDIARLRCMWERQEGSMRKVPGATSEAIESARGEIADIPLYNDSDEPQLFGETISYVPGMPPRLIALPTRWYGTVVDSIAIVEDYDPGDEDAGSASMRTVVQRAECRRVTLWRWTFSWRRLRWEVHSWEVLESSTVDGLARMFKRLYGPAAHERHYSPTERR